MVIGVPKETHHHEHRVGLNPFAVARLLKKGHTIFVESRAGEEAHFSDKDYQDVGAQIVYSPEEAYMRADLVSRFSAITPAELELIRPGLTICAFHHLAVSPKEVVAKLMELETTLIGYEIIRDSQGERPVLIPFSEMAGQMAVQIAAYYLQYETGGRGVLMGNAPGVPPPTVLILGAGSVGQSAARQAVATGAHVIVLDEEMKQLRELNRELAGHVVTAVPSVRQLEKFTAIADVIIGAILIPGARSPYLITESMVRKMKPGSVIMDISIDQGGCVETSRPTTPENPTYMVHDVLHYCVPNMTANIPRTATRALATAAIPYLVDIAGNGLEQALAGNPGLAAGVFVYKGKMVHERAGKAQELPVTPLYELLGERRPVMNWLDSYKSKLMTAAEAVQKVETGDRVYYGGNAAIPFALVRALAERKDELENVQLNHVLLLGEDPLSEPEMAGHFRHNSLFVGPADRKAVNDGRADYVPIFLYQIPRLFSQGIVPLDVAMVMVSPPDEHGFMSLGVETLASKAACRAAKHIIVQVNEQMPRILGDSFLHISRVQAIVEHTERLPTLTVQPATEVEKAIGAHIVEMIEPGATLQMGIGGIPDAIFAALDGPLDLGVHTEMISDGAMRAIEAGIVTGNNKSIHPGKVIITFALGSDTLYEFLDNNPFIEAHPVEYVNDPVVASGNDNLIAINSAVEVDLTGQVCSDSIGAYIYSGFGGQVDFIRAAARSKGGKPIIAIPATAQKGKTSRIVPFLKKGAGVVTSRADVHYVATEHGVANLFGKNLRERAEALIMIADPQFRDELIAAAKERKLLP